MSQGLGEEPLPGTPPASNLHRLKSVHLAVGAEIGGVVAKVDPEKCAVCLICVRACPYHVPYIHEDGYSVIDPSRCQGCGNCVAECPQKAIELQHYTDRQILEKSHALIAMGSAPASETKRKDLSEEGERKDG